MPYDSKIPEALQLVRLDLGLDETAVARYTLSSWNTNYEVPFFCIIDPSDADSLDMMDLQGALEETLHAILDRGGTPGDVRQIMGLEQESEIDPDDIMDGNFTPIDLGYCFSGSLLSVDAVPPQAADDLSFLTDQQISNIEMSNVGTQRNFLPAAKLLAAHEFTSWQAFAVCKAFREGIDRDCIQTIANPKRNHSQMRELARIAALDSYPNAIFKKCAEQGYPAEKLRGIRRVMADAKTHDESFSYGWLDLDTAQLAEVDMAVRMDVPEDALGCYANGKYPADSMALITLGLSDGIEQTRIDRMMNPELSQSQLVRVYTALRNDALTDRQLDFLCDPELPAPAMAAAYYGLDFCGLPLETVERYTAVAFSEEQLYAIFDAAASDGMTQAGLDVLADPQLTPQQMKSIQFSLEGGTPVADAARQKTQMVKGNRETGKTSRTGSLRDAAEESRAASSQLHGERPGERTSEREELE